MKKNLNLTFCLLLAFVFVGCKKDKSLIATFKLPPSEKNKTMSLSVPDPHTPAPPLAPVIPTRTFSATNYGVTPNDNRDDRLALQRAINALRDAGGGTLQFPAGNYILTIDPQSGEYKQAIQLYSNIRLAAQPGAIVNIKLSNGQGPYYTIFNSQSTENVSIENLKFDQNGLNNKILVSEMDYDGGAVETGSLRQIFAFSGAKRFKVHGCTFDNVLGVWVIFNAGADGSSDATITNNICKNVGGNNFDFDVSVIYTDCDRALVSGNRVTGRFTGAKGARTAFEIHGSDQNVTQNIIDKMLVGINIVGHKQATETDPTSIVNRQSFTFNTMTNVYNGFQFWTYQEQGFADILVANNNVTLVVDDFLNKGLPLFAAGQYAAVFGIGIKDWGSPITRVRIHKNTFSFTNFGSILQDSEFAAATYSAGISLATLNDNKIGINDLKVTENTVVSPLSSGFYSLINLNRANVSSNTFQDPGLMAYYTGGPQPNDPYWDNFTTSHQSGVYVWSKDGSTVKSVTISNNITKNTTEAPGIVKFGAVGKATTSDPNSKLLGNTITGGAPGAIAQVRGPGWN